MKNIKVKDLGNVLPSNGKPFSFVPIIGKREKDIYNILGRLKGGVAQQVKATLSVLLDKIGEVAFPPHTDSEALEKRLKLFSTLDIYFGDAYYMYLSARREAFGDELKITLICPSCKEKVNYTVNLGEFNVLVAENEKELSTSLDLVRPVVINGKEFTKAKITCPRFNAESLSMDNLADAQASTIAMSIRLDGYDFPISQEQVEEFPISVQRQMYLALDSVSAGISEVMQFLCPNCERTAPYFVNWEYSSFFV